MKRTIYMDANPYEVQVALVEDGDLCEMYLERKGKERTAGNVYKGIVENVLPGMQAAFVNIGMGKNAFLYAGDILSEDMLNDPLLAPEAKVIPEIRTLVQSGKEVLVQILKEASGGKGARVTTHLTFPGHLLVLMPMTNYVGVSRKIEKESERSRLAAIGREIKPEYMGLVMRTNAMDATREDLEKELAHLLQGYHAMMAECDKGKAPLLAYSEEDIYYRTVRDALNEEVEALWVNDKSAYTRIRSLVSAIHPTLLDRIRLFDQPIDLFEHTGLDKRIQKALVRRVYLKSGGYLVFDSAEALTVIDVNTGKYIGRNDLEKTIVKTNLEAAEEVARQLRLRDLSGIIVVDFIDMEERKNQTKVLETLKEAVRRDHTHTTIQGMSGLGIVEITRKKTRQSLASFFYDDCPYCGGTGVTLSTESMALKVRKEVLRLYRETGCHAVVVQASSAVCAEIQSKMRPEALLIPSHPGKRVYLCPTANMHIEHIEVQGVKTESEAVAMGGRLLSVK